MGYTERMINDLKTIAKLKRLVTDAYEEGHDDGYQRSDESFDWEHSDTKKELEIIEKEYEA